MLVFVRPSFLPLLWFSVFQSTTYNLFFPLKTCIMLSSGRKTRGYARYSPLLYFSPPFVLPDRPLQSTLEPRSRSTPEANTTTSSSRRPGVVSQAPRQEASPFRSVSLMWFVLAFLRQYLTNYVCTQILCLYNFVFGSVRPPYLVIFWFILLCLVLCCDI